jgi:nicotinate phosphoribosyltransferase
MNNKRIAPHIFKLPVEDIKKGFYSDKYFLRTKLILDMDNHHPKVLMQVFTRKKAILCGIDEAIAILKLCADNPQNIKIKALYDGDEISPWETVMTIEGDYASFAHLETVYLGVIARSTAIATSVRRIVNVANGKPVLFFSARFDNFLLQERDGYAAFIGGAQGVSTDANAILWGEEGIGTIPHGLIAAYDGNTVKSCLAFDKYMPQEIPRIALVDFDNDSVKTSLEVAKVLGRKLWGVRLDTASNIKDKSVTSTSKSSLGVCPELVYKVREALDNNGFGWVKIVISSGFDEDKIREFVKLGVPFDAIGVGSAIYKERIDFTADVVMVNDKPCAKVGRKYNPNPRLKEVDMET